MKTDDWLSLRDDLMRTTARVADLIRQSGPADTPAVGLDWTAGELAAHLVTIPTRYLRMMEHPEPFPESLSAMNQREIVEVGVLELTQLADLLTSRTNELLARLGDDPGRPVPFFAIELPVAGLCGVLLGEYALHGLDLANKSGAAWDVRPDQARWALRGLLPGAMHVVDPELASKFGGTFGLHFRPDDDWTIVVADGRATLTEGRPAKADFRITADPAAFYLLGYGRTSRLRALLSGKIVGYGRKPWLAGRLDNLFNET